MDYDEDRGIGRQRRSHSPPKWERGKKQQKKTQTDVPPDRELFVGNIPSDMDDKFLLHFLNGAMRQAKLCARHETPCLSAQINTGNFAFVEMLNPELANKCLNINGVLFLNARIKVGRPKSMPGRSWFKEPGRS
jgi:RNA recognition motif-containing protein